jgi:hypothetical protein
MVTPKRDKKALSLFFHNSPIAILKLLETISIIRRINKCRG